MSAIVSITTTSAPACAPKATCSANALEQGVCAYGKTDVRGIRVIDINKNDTSTYQTEFYSYADIMGDDPAFMFRFQFISFFTQLEYLFVNLYMQFTNMLGISNLVF